MDRTGSPALRNDRRASLSRVEVHDAKSVNWASKDSCERIEELAGRNRNSAILLAWSWELGVAIFPHLYAMKAWRRLNWDFFVLIEFARITAISEVSPSPVSWKREDAGGRCCEGSRFHSRTLFPFSPLESWAPTPISRLKNCSAQAGSSLCRHAFSCVNVIIFSSSA